MLHVTTTYNFNFTVDDIQLEGFKLYIYNSTNSHPQEVLNVQEVIEGSNVYMVDVGKIQHIKEIRLTRADVLVLCEVQVFSRKYETLAILW